MPYIINRYAGQQLVQVPDATIDDTTCDIKLIGRNYAGYGEAQNENFVFLLENFANGSPPNNPLTGQIWYDTATRQLKFYDGSGFMSSARIEVSENEPNYQSKAPGDLWFNTADDQLFAWTGTRFLLIGPAGSTRINALTVRDTSNDEHDIIAAILNEEVIFIISSDRFTLNNSNPITGFSSINEGLTLINTEDGITTTSHRYWGTASNADMIGGKTLDDLKLYTYPNIANDTSNTTLYPIMASDVGDNKPFKITKTANPFTFNPSTGKVTAKEFYAESDVSLKTNIVTVSNALDIVNQLRGVKFTWKDTEAQSFGVIAQELESVLPELVSSDTQFKSVSYDGIIGILIEAIKEQTQIINDLKKRNTNH